MKIIKENIEVRREISLKFLTWEEFKKVGYFSFKQYDTGYEVIINNYYDEYLELIYNANIIKKFELSEQGYNEALLECSKIFLGKDIRSE